MDNTTIIGQGYFTASSIGLANPDPGNAEVGQSNPAYIQIPSNADWMTVRNWTQFGTAGTDAAYLNGTANAFVGVEFFWQRGMAAGSAICKYYTNTAAVITGDTIISGGFTLYDPSGQSVGAQPLLGSPVTISAVTNATRPVVTCSSTAGLSVGTVVRLSSTAQTDVNGVDMVVGTVTNGTTFTLLTSTNALATAPGAIGGAGSFRIVYNGNSALFYPRLRYVTNITQATNAQVSTSIAHGLTPGQELRFKIPTTSGMTQLNPQLNNNYFPQSSSVAAIVQSVVDDYNFTININTTGYTAFTWPTIAQEPTDFPTVTPFGEDTATALASNTAQVPTIAGVQIYNTNTGILADSTVNTGYLGMILGAGGIGTIASSNAILGPSGSIAWTAGNAPTGDLMYWVAGKSTYGGL
jgi:hypothetical protein